MSAKFVIYNISDIADLVLVFRSLRYVADKVRALNVFSYVSAAERYRGNVIQ